MKKLIYSVFWVLVFAFASLQTHAAISCDQTFNGGYLRYDKTYEFYDTWNSGSKATYLNKFKVEYQEPGYYGGTHTSGWYFLDKGSDFHWTSQLKTAAYKVAANTSMRVLDTSPTKWRIEKHNNARTKGTSSSYDFMLAYTIDYDFSNNYPNTSDDVSHTECIYYSVTWCGDGVKDSSYEVCDPNDPTHSGWGNGGCNQTTCEPINVEPPSTCDGLTATPTSGTAPLSVNMSCTGTKATSYQIACGNGQVINGATGTCTYNTGSNYQAVCTVNGNVTSNACKKTIAVINPTPAIRIDKTDANAADLDGIIGTNDSQTVATGTKAVFKIRVTNTGNEDLNNLKVTDPVAPNCAGSVTLPGTKPATWLSFVLGGSGNHNDAFLQPGEYFEYTCEKANTTAAYTNEIDVNGKGRDSNVPVTDDDPTLVKIVDIVPACISLNVAPLTGPAPVNANVVCTGEKVQSFKVDCGNGQIFTGSGTNSGQESFTKTCNYTTSGTYTPKCFVNNTVTSPACQKTVTVTTGVSPAIQLVKSDANPADLDGNVGNDTQTVNTGSGAIFRITVTNTGTEGLTNIVLTDPVAPNCAGLVTLPSTFPATFSNFAHTGNGDTVFNPGETFTYTCSKANTTVNYTNIANVTANGITSGTTVNSTDPTQVILPVIVDPSILIDKVDANSADRDGNIGNDTQTVSSGSGAVFKIRVTNNGIEALKNIVLTDTLAPNCAGSVTLPGTKPTTWSNFVIGGSGDHTDALLQSGEYFEYTCDKANTTAAYTNTAGVAAVGDTSGKPVSDTDTSPVLLSVVPSILIDKVDANPDDSDKNTGNDTQTVNSGAKAVFKIRVTNNGGEDLRNIVLTDTLAPNCAGSVTLPGTKPATWLSFVLGGSGDHSDTLLQVGEYFEFTCEKDNTTSNYTNIAGVTGVGNTSGTTVSDDDSSEVKIPGSSSSSSSGGSPNDCYSIEQTATTIRCIGDNQTKNFKLDCGNGKQLISGDSKDVSGSTRQYWDFSIADCKYDTTPKTGIAQCYVATRVGGEPSWRTRFQCQLTETAYCGDGIIQTGEQCEKTIEHTCSNGSTPTKNSSGDYICSNGVKATAVLGSFPAFCSSSCKFTGGGSSSSGGDPTGVLTIPNHGDIVFGPIWNMVIGHGKNPLVENGEMPYIRNDSDYDLYFDQLCVTKKTGNTLDGTQTQCKNLGDILYPGEIVKFDSYPIYTGNKNNIPAGQSYGSNDLITTIKTEGELYDWAFFASKLGVRVSKPAISTTGGGTSLVKDTSKMANVSDVADGVTGLTKENNKNFVWVGVGENTSSYSDTVTDSTAVQTVVNTGSGLTHTLTTKVNTDSVNVALANVTSLESAELKSYNGLQNVFILKGKNLVIDSIPSGLRGATTYIVEGGDLVINGNLLYSENIAFVVKGGNIRVADDVTKITGTYITIPVSGNGGNIIAEPSDKQLVVSGSLYGNISQLVDNRTYIDNNSTKGVINVGTIVSFGSSLFKKPAPLVGQFISEYVATQKVAK